jgi:signal transduction histidine kinase/ActR/RegA family two-component response regulator
MSPTVNYLAAEYGAALREYLTTGSEAAFKRTSDIGRRAFTDGVTMADLVTAHQQAVREASASAGTVARSLASLAESLGPYETALRAVRESNRLVDDAKAQAARQFEFLAEASNVLVRSFDAPASLAAVARMSVPFLSEWCFVTLIEDNGTMRQLEISHSGDHEHSGDLEIAERLRGYCLFRAKTIVEAAGMTSQITPHWCDAVAEDQEHAQLLRRFCGQSAMIAPLHIRDRIMGALTFIAAPGAVPYSGQDLALVEDLARRCALALENARLYRAVIAERDRAEKASRGKDEFLAILSHELRNPLMPVIGWTRMLKSHSLIAQDPVLAEGARSMERNARILGRLVGDCLDLARISEGKIQMERRPVDLNQIILASIEAVQGIAEEKSLKVSYQPREAIFVLGDATRLEQVVMNLLVNAVKYTDGSGEVSVACRQRDVEAELEVRDTGIGIHPAFLEHIFEPFRRGSGSWLTNQSGLGLGLAIARRIVETHGGKIWAESKGVDQGSTFFVRLPMAALASTDGIREFTSAQDSSETGNLRILLIEDSEDILFLLRIELETLGHAVSTAADGSRGLELARTFHPDLIISDIKMPGLNGYELIREIRASEELKNTPAIALTGFGAKADFDRAIKAGFDACISKPAEPHEISALIKKLTERDPESC